MTTSRIPAAIALALATFTLFGSSCTAIFAPRDDVQRCSTAEDCDPTGDNRYTPLCKFDDANLDLDSSQVDKICVADFKASIGCDPATYTVPDHPYRIAFDELGDSARYVVCDEMTRGQQGCLPMTGGACADGLSVSDLGVCDDDDPNTPKAYRADTQELLGQDVRDQFCRSFFCDDRFVCDGDSNFCVICDDDEVLGEGGCGEIYISGVPSCAYDDDSCVGADVKTEDTSFGCGM